MLLPPLLSFKLKYSTHQLNLMGIETCMGEEFHLTIALQLDLFIGLSSFSVQFKRESLNVPVI